MKTTIELPDELVEEAKRIAANEGVTLEGLLERAVREALASRKPVSGAAKDFVLRDGSADAGPLKPEFEGNWPAIRDEIYRGP